MEKSESIKNIAIALCAFQGEVETIQKTAINPFFKSAYADLADILNVIRQPLVKNGLSFVQFPKDKCELNTVLMHTSGEWMSESFEMKPTKDDPQGAGSVITYQRRYALGAILGLNIDKDDDGNSGSVKVTKLELTPKDNAWKQAVKYLQGDGTMTEILKKYVLSEANQKLLISEIV